MPFFQAELGRDLYWESIENYSCTDGELLDGLATLVGQVRADYSIPCLDGRLQMAEGTCSRHPQTADLSHAILPGIVEILGS